MLPASRIRPDVEDGVFVEVTYADASSKLVVYFVLDGGQSGNEKHITSDATSPVLEVSHT